MYFCRPFSAVQGIWIVGCLHLRSLTAGYPNRRSISRIGLHTFGDAPEVAANRLCPNLIAVHLPIFSPPITTPSGTACLKVVLSASTIISFISLASSSELRKADRGNMSYSLNSFKGHYIGALIGLIRGILGI